VREVNRDWRTGLSWLVYVLATLRFFAVVYDFIAGRTYVFSLIMAALFALIGTGPKILAQRPRL